MEGRLKEPWCAQAQLIVPEDLPFVTLAEPLAARVSEKGHHLTAQALRQWSPVQYTVEGKSRWHQAGTSAFVTPVRPCMVFFSFYSGGHSELCLTQEANDIL